MRNLTIFIFVVLCVSCGSPVNDSRLVAIDSLLQQGYPDSAMHSLEQINPAAYNDADMAYYNLLLSIAEFRTYVPVLTDTIIDVSIDYYENTTDYTHLAAAYVQKAIIMSFKDKTEDAVVYLKMAEKLLPRIESAEWRIRVLSGLAAENEHARNYESSIEYGKRALSEAKSMGNKRWLGYCYSQLGIPFEQKDSSAYYFEQAEQYIPYMPIAEQSTAYAHIALCHWWKGDLDTAEKYLNKAKEIYPNGFLYSQIAELYTQQGRTEEARRLWERAADSSDNKMRIAFAMPYASWLRQQGRNDEAWEIMKRLPAMKDSLARRQKTEAIKEIQDRYDKEWATLRLQRMLAYAVGGIVALLLLGIVVWMYLRWKAQRTKRELAEKQLLIVDYSQQIERLSKEGKENSAEMRQLEKQLDRVRSDMQSMIYNGKRLMEHVKAGGNTAVWKKKDFENVIEYYRTVNLPFVMHLEKDYRSLTPSNMFMLLLAEELKYNDAKIAECMMMSPGALRTAKSRINSRHLGQGKD